MARSAKKYIISGGHRFDLRARAWGFERVERATGLRAACALAKNLAFDVQGTTRVLGEKDGKEIAAFRWDERDVVVKRGRCPGPVLQRNRDGLDGSRRRRAR